MPAVDPDLVELLVCPSCRGAIEYKERRELIICTACGLHYPVRDGIPIMLIDEATRPEPKKGQRSS
ncbi:MAG: Trm112 family protein [Egibacteraceae bacterium]